MKILLFALNGRGGMLHYTSQFANALSKKSEVYVVLPSYSDSSLFGKNIKIIKINAPPCIFGTILNTLKLWQHSNLIKKIKKINPDIIHIMDNHPWYYYYSYKLKKFKMFVTQHDPKLHSGESLTIRGIISNHINKVLRKRADKIVVHGENLKKFLVKNKVYSSKIIVVPHGTYEFFTKWKKSSIKVEEHTILCFGRIVKYKGIDTLLKSIPFVIKEIPNLKVIIAGEGNLSPYSKYLTSNIKDNVELINKYISDAEVAELFQKCSFVVLPYDDATQSGVIPIAYSFKKPVITTNVGILSEVVDNGKTGFIIKPKNPKALSDAILKMFKQNLNLMGNKAYKKMKDVMDWDKIAEKVAEFYKEK
jgi:glycosyltransferase involved in cell wall biosynthesis